MLRFSIRELMLLTLTAGIAVGWYLDHKQLTRALIVANLPREPLNRAYQRHSDELSVINKELASHGLGLWQLCGGGFHVGTSIKSDSKPGPQNSLD